MSDNFKSELNTAFGAAQTAAGFIRNNFERGLNIRSKNEYDELVTDLDHQSEKLILERLQYDFPAYNIISEESTAIDNQSRLSWMVDPLDGTSNLVIGLPIVGVSIALLVDNEPVVGVVVNVMRDLCFTAIRGEGAYMNNAPIRVSDKTEFRRTHVGHIVSFEEKLKPRALELVTTLRSSCRRMLDTWAPAIEWSLLAQGKIDALVSLGSGPLDRLAGMLIAQEAGAMVSFVEMGGESRDDFLVASANVALHSKLLELVHRHYR